MGVDIEMAADIFEGDIGSAGGDSGVAVEVLALQFSEEGIDIHPALDI